MSGSALRCSLLSVVDGGYTITFSNTTSDQRECPIMSVDKSLRTKSGLGGTRSVLTRAERIEKLMRDEKWEEGRSPFGLPKVRVQKIVLKKAKKKEAPTEDDKKKK